MELRITILCYKTMNSGGVRVNTSLSSLSIHFNGDITSPCITTACFQEYKEVGVWKTPWPKSKKRNYNAAKKVADEGPMVPKTEMMSSGVEELSCSQASLSPKPTVYFPSRLLWLFSFSPAMLGSVVSGGRFRASALCYSWVVGYITVWRISEPCAVHSAVPSLNLTPQTPAWTLANVYFC